MKRAFFLPVLTALLLSGCVNAYKQYYQAFPHKPVPDNYLTYCPNEEPIIRPASSTPDKTMLEMYSKGWVAIGYSRFILKGDNAGDLKSFTKELHACAAVVHSKYLGTEQGFTPIFQYNPPPSYNVNTTGNIGATAYNANTTVQSNNPGTMSTSYVPYSVEKHGILVEYYIKMKPGSIFGAWTGSLPEAKKKELGRNTGQIVFAVRNDSPAYYADILAGDVIIGINGIDWAQIQQERIDLFTPNKGKTISLQINRDGKEITKEVKLGQGE